MTQGTLVVIQGTLVVIQGTSVVIQGTLFVIQGTLVVIQGTLVVIQGTFVPRTNSSSVAVSFSCKYSNSRRCDITASRALDIGRDSGNIVRDSGNVGRDSGNAVRDSGNIWASHQLLFRRRQFLVQIFQLEAVRYHCVPRLGHWS